MGISLFSKTSIFLLIVIIGMGAYIFFGLKSSSEIEASYIKKEKDELRRVRDSATVARDIMLDTLQANVDTLIQINTKIKYVPYEKLKYVDRGILDAIRILDSTEYNR